MIKSVFKFKMFVFSLKLGRRELPYFLKEIVLIKSNADSKEAKTLAIFHF